MKKIITMISAFILTVCFLSFRNVEAIVDLDISDYEVAPNTTLTWESIGVGADGFTYESSVVAIKRNQVYLVPVTSEGDNYYIELYVRYYDENKKLVKEIYSEIAQSNIKDFDWVRTKYDNGTKSQINMLITIPENVRYLSFQFDSRSRDEDPEPGLELIKDFVKLYRIKTDEIPPVIQGEGVYITNVDHPVTLNDIKSTLEAYDNVDGNISSSLTVKSDTYSGNEEKVGTYKVVFECTDSSNNVAQYEVTIKVFDVTDPTLESMEYEVISSMSDAEKTIEQIKALLSARDNIDGDLTEYIEVIEDNYSGNEDKTGRYKLTFKVTDEAGNYATCEVYISVKDNIPPIILVEGTIIPISVFETLTFADIKSILLEYLAEQNLEVEDIYEISNEYNENKDKAGNYNVKFGYRLANGSTNEIDLNVLVYEPETNANTLNKDNNNTVYYLVGSVLVLGLLTGVILIGYKKKKQNTN